jgi:hypothetical protein
MRNRLPALSLPSKYKKLGCSFFQRRRGYLSFFPRIIAMNFEVPEWDKLAPYLAFLLS